MFVDDTTIPRLGIALGIGLLVGIERERSHSADADQRAAGVRTFSLTALLGATSVILGDVVTVIAFGLIVGALIALSYLRTRNEDPGMTSEIAQISTFVLGALAMRRPQIAGGVAVLVTILLASRTRLHYWIRNVLTDTEIHDALLLAAAALIVLPLTPNRTVDPWGVINPRLLWTLAVTVMAINSLGYIALRVAGARVGLLVAGLFSGFVSSTATIAAMATRAHNQPELRLGAVAGAATASVASLVELAVVIGVVNVDLLRTLGAPLFGAGIVALIYAVAFAFRNARQTTESAGPAGRPFDPKAALIFVLVVGTALAAAALLTQWLGSRGLVLAGAVSGLGDVHASAISAASLSLSGNVELSIAAYAVLAGLSANAISKTIVAFSLGGQKFGWTLLPGILLPVATSWLALCATHLLR